MTFSINTTPALCRASATQQNHQPARGHATPESPPVLRVNGPKDDASNFAIATHLRGDIKGIESVEIALATTIRSSMSPFRPVIDRRLVDGHESESRSGQPGRPDSASRTALNNDFTSLCEQLTTIVVSAEFNNTNLITSAATNLTVLSTVDGSTITVSVQAMDTNTLGISTAVLNTSAGASNALTQINTAINLVADKLASLGSSQSGSRSNQNSRSSLLISSKRVSVIWLMQISPRRALSSRPFRSSNNSVCRHWQSPTPARRVSWHYSSRGRVRGSSQRLRLSPVGVRRRGFSMLGISWTNGASIRPALSEPRLAYFG